MVPTSDKIFMKGSSIRKYISNLWSRRSSLAFLNAVIRDCISHTSNPTAAADNGVITNDKLEISILCPAALWFVEQHISNASAGQILAYCSGGKSKDYGLDAPNCASNFIRSAVMPSAINGPIFINATTQGASWSCYLR